MNSMHAKHKIFLNCLRENLRAKRAHVQFIKNNIFNISFTFSWFHFFICYLKLLSPLVHETEVENETFL